MPEPPQREDNAGNSRQWRCGVCQFMLPENLEVFKDDDYLPHRKLPESPSGGQRTDISRLWRSIDRGCDVCAAIPSIMSAWRNDLSDLMALHWVDGKLTLKFQGKKKDKKFVVSIEHEEAEGFASRDFRDIHPSLDGGGRNPSGDTGSSQVFDMLKNRMRDCSHRHRQCAAGDEAGLLPQRLLYIENATSATVRLVDDTGGMEPQPYVCLSHRWAEQTLSSSLTVDRVATFKARIPEALLYPLLRDAFVATERLGLRYIWIDCLCICQDDLDDWNEQAAQMARIYENAAVTISALDAQLNDGRLFCTTPAEKLCTRGGRTVMIREASPPHPFFIDTVGPKYRASSTNEHYPLLARGWVYQERLLSRRIAHFTRSEVVWECREALACECGSNEQAWAMVKRQSPRLADMEWRGVCSEYAKTELSVDADRLPALSGVARRFGEARGWTYLAGLWWENPDLPVMLLWFNSKSQTRTHAPGLPSWSWASVRAAVFHPVFQRREVLYRIVEHELVPGAVPYSTPSSVRIVVEGRCSTVTILFKPGSFENGTMTFAGDDTQHGCFMDYVLEEDEKAEIEQSRDLIFLLCLRDNDDSCGLVLKPVRGLRENTFERIAFFSKWGGIEQTGVSWERKRLTLV